MKRMSMNNAFRSEHTHATSAFYTATSIMRADVRRTSALCFVLVPLLPFINFSIIIVRLLRSCFSPARACPVH